MVQAADKWDVDQYERFKAERSKPFFDLLEMVQPKPKMTIVDLGCGTGELTASMHSALRATATLGIDSSAAMLAKSSGFLTKGLRFERADIAEFRSDETFDLVFSNAALQWLPDQRSALASIYGLASPGGQIAIQVPANWDSVSQTVAVEIASEEPYNISESDRNRCLLPEEYVRSLHELGFQQVNVRLQVYAHLLESRASVVEWVKGTVLTRYERQLPPQLFAQFLAEYRTRLEDRLADERPFLFPFKRILMHAFKPAKGDPR